MRDETGCPHNHMRRTTESSGSSVCVEGLSLSLLSSELKPVERVVMEMIETERTYVSDLRSVIQDYLAHIIDSRDLPISPEQVSSLFGNIENIYQFNSALLHSLDQCAGDPVAVARCFVNESNSFEIYTQYCTNYPTSVAVLTECLQDRVLLRFLRERQSCLRQSLPLGSYLLKPVQRILKYHLLLQEIANHFDPQQRGYEVLTQAIHTMTGVAWYINDMKRKHEHAVRLQEVQSLLLNWTGPDFTTFGELVLEGTFPVHRAKHQRTLFLFQRLLIITKRRGEHYVCKSHISCSTLMLNESAKDSLLFSVMHYKHPKQPHTVQVRTAEEKKLWTHHIKRLILENHHALIPQKAKDAILDMDSACPVRFFYSPEQPERRRSAPPQLLLSSSSEPVKKRSAALPQEGFLKHADSAGDLGVAGESRGDDVLGSPVTSSPTPLEAEQRRPEDKPRPPVITREHQLPRQMKLLPVSVVQRPAADVAPREIQTEEACGREDAACGRGLLLCGADAAGGVASERSADACEIQARAGEVTAEVTGVVKGEVMAEVTGEIMGEIMGEVTGEVTGGVTGEVTCEVMGEVTGEVTSEATDRCPELRLTPGHAPSDTLSRRDRALLRNIRRYYQRGHAPSAPPRRDSLSFIPPGLVQGLSQQLSSRCRLAAWDVFRLPGPAGQSQEPPSPSPAPPETRSSVFLLARRYSQRLRPAVTSDPARSAGHQGHAPSPAQAESFHWPDVKQLRSRYSPAPSVSSCT